MAYSAPSLNLNDILDIALADCVIFDEWTDVRYADTVHYLC